MNLLEASDTALVSSWADATELTVNRRLLSPASAPSPTLEARRPDDCDARADRSSEVMRRVLQFGCGGESGVYMTMGGVGELESGEMRWAVNTLTCSVWRVTCDV